MAWRGGYRGWLGCGPVSRVGRVAWPEIFKVVVSSFEPDARSVSLFVTVNHCVAADGPAGLGRSFGVDSSPPPVHCTRIMVLLRAPSRLILVPYNAGPPDQTGRVQYGPDGPVRGLCSGCSALRWRLAKAWSKTEEMQHTWLQTRTRVFLALTSIKHGRFYPQAERCDRTVPPAGVREAGFDGSLATLSFAGRA